MALSLVISCSLIINLLGEVESLDFRHINCFIPFEISFVLALLINEIFFIIIGFT